MPDFDVTNREQLEAWLKTQPREVAVLIAARAALRVVPVLEPLLSDEQSRGRRAGSIILAAFRALRTAWVAGTWPAHGVALRAAAADDADSAAAAVGADSAAAYSAYAATYAAARAARSAHEADVITAETAATGDRDDASYAVYVATPAANAIVAGAQAAGEYAQTDVVPAYASDVDAVTAGHSLARAPLWPRGRTPDWAESAWQLLKDYLFDLDEDWDVWTDWYEARLFGDPGFEMMEVVCITIPEWTWAEGARFVNAEIKRFIEERERPPGTPRRRAARQIRRSTSSHIPDTRPWRVGRADGADFMLESRNSTSPYGQSPDDLRAAIEEFKRASDEAHRVLEFLDRLRAGIGHNSIPAGVHAGALPAAIQAELEIAEAEVRKPILERDRLIDVMGRLRGIGEDIQGNLLDDRVQEERGALSREIAKLRGSALDEFAKAYGKRLGDLSAYVTWAVVATAILTAAHAIGAILAHLPT